MEVFRQTESLTQSLIFERVIPRNCICYLRVKSPVSLRSPWRPLTKWGGHKKRISKWEKPIFLMWLDLILIKAMGIN
jgi:hypothetical protein